MNVDESRAVVQVEVSDDGPGIPDESKGRIFDRFVRLDADRDRRGGGTGLGLAIVREVARAHRGHVRATDSKFGGTTILVELPLGPLT
jgi:signal transduction histidine kinase